MACHCETLPDASDTPEHGTLYLAPPLAHTEDKLRHFLRTGGFTFTEPLADVLAVSVGPGELHRMGTQLTNSLSAEEIKQTRALLLPEGQEAGLRDLLHMNPLDTLLARAGADWLVNVMRDGRLTAHFQPIVHTEDPANVYAYEALLRGVEREGTLIAPSTLFGTALPANMLNQLERAGRHTVVHEAARCEIETNLFVNFNPATIYDPAFCLRSTLQAVKATNIKPEHLVFEVVESTEVKDVKHLLRIVDFYRERGFRVALDDVGTGFNSLNLLTKLKPDFLKLDVELVNCVDHDPYKAVIARKLLELAQDLGIATIAEGVETEAEYAWVREHGANYVQGYLFARPANPPPIPRVLLAASA